MILCSGNGVHFDESRYRTIGRPVAIQHPSLPGWTEKAAVEALVAPFYARIYLRPEGHQGGWISYPLRGATMNKRVSGLPVRKFVAITLRPVIAVLLLAMTTAPADAQDTGFLGNLPSAEQVFAQFGGGGDPVQSLGRQCAALDLLERQFFRSPVLMTPAVSSHPATVAKQADYQAGFVRLREQYSAAVGGMDDAKQRTWSRMCERGGQGVLDRPVTPEQVLAIVPQSVRAAVDAIEIATEQRSADLRAEQQVRRDEAAERAQANRPRFVMGLVAGLPTMGFGALLMILSGRHMYRRGKYEFEHTTDGGVVRFKSLGEAIRHRTTQGIAAWGAVIGLMTFLGGCVAVIVNL